MNIEKIEGILPENTFFIHGNLASNRWWYPSEEIWRKHAKSKAQIGSMFLAEFKGCGKSPAPKSQAEVDMNLFADEFIAQIENMKISPLHLVGHSTGGLIAAIMLSKKPELFKKAVLLDPVGAEGIKFDDSMTAAFEAMKTDKGMVTAVMAGTIYNCDQNTDFFKQIVVEDAFHAVQTVGLMVLKSFDGLDVREKLKTIPNQVLVLHGEHDVLLPIEESKKISQLIKNSRFEVFAGKGHCPNAEDPAGFVSKISSFLYN